MYWQTNAGGDGAAPAMPGEPVVRRLGPDGGCVLKCEPTLMMIASYTSKERLEIRSLRRDEVVAFATKLAPQHGEASGVA
jgi:hypothetical protein